MEYVGLDKVSGLHMYKCNSKLFKKIDDNYIKVDSLIGTNLVKSHKIINNLKDLYCKSAGYSSFNEYNSNDYSNWLEKKINAITEVIQCVNTNTQDAQDGIDEILFIIDTL